ncbi:MAG: prepilin peptidase [Candidatus Eisenbacteria bacterium]|nr:prepilin peptidase [Candidatus Latescibacterota bacterium]MBD3302308.1 prepilin peptidase [Candidatus Eisenbacteria bacterium]
MNAAWVPDHPLAWGLLALLGLSFGSFLNVVIARLPSGGSLLRPPSSCPECGSRIAPYDNVPLVSYVLLRGRCRRCGSRIPLRYPVVEGLGAAAVLLAAAGSAGPLEAAVRAAFLLTMATIAWIDLDHRIIPDEISLPGVALGLLLCPLLGVSRLDGLIGAVAGAGSLLAVAQAYKLLRGIDGMGMGDVKLAAMMGAFLGWRGILLTLVLGSFVGALLGTVLLLSRRGDGRTALPYGTFLAPAAGLVLLVGPRIWSWYTDLLAGGAAGSW